jgi:hypothetical protein
MLKKNLKRVSAIAIAAMAIANTASAQTPIWGYGTGNDDANGRFSKPFVNAPASLADSTWNAISVYQDSSASNPTPVKPGAAYWTRTLNGQGQGNYFNSADFLGSTSVADGAALFDSDYLDDPAGAAGTGTAPAFHEGVLVSPKMDLSAVTDSSLNISFHSLYRDFFVYDLSVGLSLDNGVTWVDKDYRAYQGSSTDGRLTVPFIDVLKGATSLTSCRLRFRFNGNYYYAMVDDVTVTTMPQFDLALTDLSENVTSGNLFRAGGAILPGNAYEMPEKFIKNNAASTDLTAWIWGARVINRGSATVDSLTFAPQLNISIDFLDTAGNVISGIYKDSVALRDVAVTQYSSTNYWQNDFRNLDFIKNNTAGVNGTAQGRYTVNYFTSLNITDGNPLNDTLKYTFRISDGYYSRVARAASDNKPTYNTTHSPTAYGNDETYPFNKYEIASMYYFPDMGTDNKYRLDSIVSRIRTYSSYTGAADVKMFVNIYEYADGSNGGAANGLLDGDDELVKVGIKLDTVKGLTAGTIVTQLTSGFVSPSGAALGNLKANTMYMISYEQSKQLLGADITSDNVLRFMGDGRFNQICNLLTTDSGRVQGSQELHRKFAVTPDPATFGSNWRWYGNFFAPAPLAIGLYGEVILDPSTNVVEVAKTTINANLYPSPAATQVNMDVAFDEATTVQYIVTDVTGRVLNFVTNKNVTVETVSFDVSGLAQGVYFITAKAGNNVVTKRFVKK